MFEGLVRRLGGANESIGRFLVICMSIGFTSLLAAGIVAFWSTARNQTHTAEVNHTYEVKLEIDEARVFLEQGETTRRGYLLSRDPYYLDSYRASVRALPEAIERIATLTVDNPRQQANIAQFRTLVADLTAQRDRSMHLVEAGRGDEALRLFRVETNAKRIRYIRNLAVAMAREEDRLLVIRDAEQRASVAIFYIVLGVAGLLLVAVALLSLATVQRFTSDLSASRDALRDFADSLEDDVRERTADLTRANDEIQRFAYIVSHDLRSPLVNVMGFTAELEAATAAIGDLIDRAEATAPAIVTEDARNAAREDLPEAIGFIRTSTQKMDRLINAILRLSREGRRVIAPQPVDIAEIVRGIDGSLRHLIEDRGATLEIDGALPPVITDRLALEQILSNLIENAIKYLMPGRPGQIVVRGSREGPRVVIEVEDNGRGIEPRDHARVFDLFRRSGNQDQPGEGIGLAHVRALAYRLGGVIDVSSELGKGATFRLVLPAVLADPQVIPQGTQGIRA